MDDFDRVRQKIRDLQSRFLGAQGTGSTLSPESLPAQDFWKRQYEDEKRKWEEQLLMKTVEQKEFQERSIHDELSIVELSRRIQEMESRLSQRSGHPPAATPDNDLKQKFAALQDENIDLKAQINKVFQLHKNELQANAEFAKQLETEKSLRQEDLKTLRQGMETLKLENEKKILRLEQEKMELAKLIDEIKSNNFSFVAEHKILKEENAILKENMMHHNETVAMREKLQFNSMEKMVEGLSRRLKNYFSLMTGSVEYGLHSGDLNEARQHMAQLMETRNQSELTVDEFLQLSKYPEPSLEQVPVNELLESVIRGLDEPAKKAQVSFAKNWGKVPAVLADRHLLKDAFHQIILNAIQASGPGSTIQLNTFHHPAAQKIEVHIIDMGHGMSDKVLGKIFQPYFTTKKGHQGLGLCQAKKLIQLHHGWISVSSEGIGTTLAVELPESKAR